MKCRTMYMLTINGRPAGQRDDGFTFFACASGPGNHRVPLFSSLRHVKAAIARGEQDYRREFPTLPLPFRLDYARVAVPVEGER